VIKKLGVEGLRERTRKSLDVAAYAEKVLREVEPAVWRNPSALTVNIPKPDKAIIKKWQLASGSDWAHIICMPGVDKEQIDAFVKELKESKIRTLALVD